MECFISPREDGVMQLCVLSSSSRGNCSALLVGEGAARRLFLIDLGLSPRRTRALLDEVGLIGVPIAGALMTHFDSDHWNTGWVGAFPEDATLYVHREHRGRADRSGATYLRTCVFEDALELCPGVCARMHMNAHDDQGTVAYRIEADAGGEVADLGYATDIGRASAALTGLMRGVDVLAVESNYCPDMQLASSRPEFLKRRIMNGGGHLSNQQSAALVRGVSPRSSVVLLHLSLECNTPQRAAMFHRHDPLRLTIAAWDRPTEWIVANSAPRVEITRRASGFLWGSS